MFVLFTAQKLKFSIKDFFSECNFFTLTEEIFNGKLHFLCSGYGNLAFSLSSNVMVNH